MAVQRLDKILASTGRWSRREVKLLVRQGRVLADGRPAASPEEKYDPAVTALTVDGEDIGYRDVTWLMMNKPGGVLSATEDGQGTTVLDLLSPELRRIGLFPVGRLDKDTEGLLLLTNDGDLAHHLLSPRHHVDKVYFVRVAGRLTAADQAAFREGMILGDGLHCMPAELEILTAGENSEAHVTLREGKFHQVKRMLAALGKPVLYLKRVEMGKLPLDIKLAPGDYRFLTEEELELLRQV
ncbi:pseudouridine synthase [Dysosmobacter sp. HCP28S3_G4]|uniref:pseudouridine synthase n=1 Tax=Dysosmobacter sp. HCP28S3_G4 TaxID=3438938 RepID=UPI003F049D91